MKPPKKGSARAALARKSRERIAVRKLDAKGFLWSRAEEAEAQSNYPLAAKLYQSYGLMYNDQDALDLAQGMIHLKTFIENGGHLMDLCSHCGHPRQEHTLILACIQCITADKEDSTCRAFCP